MTDTDHVESSSHAAAPSQAVPQVAVSEAVYQVFPYNFPLPHATKCHGDVVGNWDLNLLEEDKKKVDKCMEVLDNYFKPSRNVVYERYVFNTCVQQNEESVQSYVTRLRRLAASCEYGELADEFIRDRLVIDLKNRGYKVRLLREKKLDLQKAIQMCTPSEVASRQMKNIQGTEDKQTEEVKKYERKKKKKTRKKEREKSSKAKKNSDKKTKREFSETK